VQSVRVQQSAPASLTWRPPDQGGEPVTATGTPTVTVTRADGTALIPANTPTLAGGVVTLVLTASETALLDQLTVVWLLDGVARGRTVVDVVGGFITNLEALRVNQSPHLDNTLDATVLARRDEVESWFERYCRRAFVPRFTAETVTTRRGWTEEVSLRPNLRAIRWVTEYGSPNVWTTILADNVEIVDEDSGLVTVGGRRRLRIGYEHGMDVPPPEIESAAAIAVRLAVSSPRIRIDDFGQAFTGLAEQDRRDMFGPLKAYRMALVG
jgi:hypothetical protein